MPHETGPRAYTSALIRRARSTCRIYHEKGIEGAYLIGNNRKKGTDLSYGHVAGTRAAPAAQADLFIRFRTLSHKTFIKQLFSRRAHRIPDSVHAQVGEQALVQLTSASSVTTCTHTLHHHTRKLKRTGFPTASTPRSANGPLCSSMVGMSSGGSLGSTSPN